MATNDFVPEPETLGMAEEIADAEREVGDDTEPLSFAEIVGSNDNDDPFIGIDWPEEV